MFKKTILLFFLIYACLTPLFSQNVGINVKAGATMTFLPDFENRVVITNEGLVIPGLVKRNNSNGVPFVGTPTSQTSMGAGFFMNVEMWKLFGKRYRYAFMAGVQQFRYSYDTYIDFENPPPYYLSNIDQDYGKTCLLYLELQPLNFAIQTLKKKLTLTLGPSLDILIHQKLNNIIILYETYQGLDGTSKEVIDQIYFDSADNLNQTLLGCFAEASFTLFSPLELSISGHYYFSSVYKDKESFGYAISETRPVQVRAGLRYTLYRNK